MHAYTIAIDGGPDTQVADLNDLKSLLAEFRRGGGEEIFLNRDDGSWTAVLISGDRAFVSLSIEIDRENYFAVEPDFAGVDAFISFRLSNGQIDEHPRSSTVTVDAALASIEDFFSTGTRPQRLNWQQT